MARRSSRLALGAVLVGALLGSSAFALVVPKENGSNAQKAGRNGLANRVLSSREMAVVADSESMETARPFVDKAKANAFENFKLLAGSDQWTAEVDHRTGLVSYSEGAGIPWVPGRGNKLGVASVKALGSADGTVTMGTMEKAARRFLPSVAEMLGINPNELVLNQGRSGHPASHVWFVDFDVTRNGMVVEGAHVVFRVNNGNLIQFGTENLPAPGATAPRQKVTRDQAKAALADYVGGFDPTDKWVDQGSLHLRPVNVVDDSKSDGFEHGNGRGMMLTWDFTFKRPGEMGTWVGRVNAATGEMVEFKDRNEYGQATGGTYKQDRPAAEVVMPLPWANVATGVYTNSAGIFSGTTGTTTLQGQYVKITDSCGTISKAADASGNIALGSGTGTDCTIPSGGGGAGNTHAARTQFYDVNRIKEKGRGWLPSNTWLQGSLVASVNLNQTCNAYWDGTKLNFFKSGGGCANTGELPGVSLHEFGHGLDTNDGSGDPPDNGTGETTGDFTAALITHQSCTGNGFLTSNCGGYGNACTACTGVRDIDYAKHSTATPSTVANFTQPLCPAPSASEGDYVGPCGHDADARGTTSKRKEGHCESIVSSQGLWDLAARDMPNPGSGSAWATVDRLWYLSRATATGSAFQCNTSGTTWTSDGCLTGGLFRVFRAIDDDNGNLADGTPHGGAIFNAFNRHGMACSTDAGASTTFAAVTPPAAPTLSVTAGNNAASLSWSGSTGVYDVFRNETGCSAGFVKVASGTSATTFNDTNVANGITYYYQVAAFPSGNEAASSAPSTCQSVTPTVGTCTPPAAPTGVTASSSSQTGATVSWAASSGATSYNILRSTTSGSGYVQVGTSSTTSFTDSGLACNTTYYYVVQASNGTCASGNSAQASATTTACSSGGTATYDSTLKAPSCSTVGASCDTGASLVLGRATLGPEPNQPNTINGSCADGTSGAFHSDESNDRLKVYTVDGTNFAAGKSVKVEATVWAYSSFSSDHLDLYYAANANSPSWTLIGTINPTVAGSQVLTGTYTLPAGSLQAVRAVFRYNGSAAACGTNSGYDDHDDLVFAVTGSTCTPPAAPTGVTASSSSQTGATVSWTASSGATSYKVFRSTTSGGPYTQVGTSSTTSFTDSGLTCGTTYYYVVTASNGTCDSGNSAQASAATSACSGGGNAFLNPGFEAGALTSWTATGASETAQTTAAHSGTYGARLGLTTPTNGDSTISQTVTVPAGDTKVTFWYKMTCPDTVTYDWFTATLKDNTTATTTTIQSKVCTTNSWTQVTATATAGHSVTLTLTSHDDNYSADPSYTFVDDIATQ